MLNVAHIKADLVAAMKSGEALKLSVLRMLASELGYKQIEVQRDLTDEDVIVVLNKEAKKRREAIESFTKGGRPEQVQKERQELEILQAYLPAQLSEAEIRTELAELQLPVDFGRAMKIASPLFRGRADGSLVASIVKQLLI